MKSYGVFCLVAMCCLLPVISAQCSGTCSDGSPCNCPPPTCPCGCQNPLGGQYICSCQPGCGYADLTPYTGNPCGLSCYVNSLIQAQQAQQAQAQALAQTQAMIQAIRNCQNCGCGCGCGGGCGCGCGC